MVDSDRPSLVNSRVTREKKAFQSGNKPMPKGKAFGNTEGRGHVEGFLIH